MLLGFDTGPWFVLADDGRLDCSEEGEGWVRFVKGTEVCGAERHWDRFYTDGLLGRLVGGSWVGGG